jgi:hypothetical protein
LSWAEQPCCFKTLHDSVTVLHHLERFNRGNRLSTLCQHHFLSGLYCLDRFGKILIGFP